MRLRSLPVWWMTATVFLTLLWTVQLAGQAKTTKKKVETTAIKTQANPTSGVELFKSYCASCHGMQAKGDGPVAESLRMRPSNLTELSKRNQGTFPVYRVEQLLGGTDDLAPHGSKTMPVWGPVFRSINNDEGLGALRVRNLVSYLESIQRK